MSSQLFDSDVSLENNVTEGLDKNNQAETGSRESNPSNSPLSEAAYYNGFNDGGRYV
jgi:hypothetical protein